jgi:tetratricopeptide (TPR) repeat protein
MLETNRSEIEESAESARHLCQQAAELWDQADYAAARVLYERALAFAERAFGREHPDTARCLHGLAQAQMRQNEDAGARLLLEEALDIQERTLGPEHPDTAASQHTLGELKSNQGDVEAGLELMTQAFITRQLALGLEHPDTIESMILLALMLAQQGDTASAIRQMEWVLSVCEPALGEEHRTTARVLNGLGRLYAANEETYDQARSLYERALAIYERLVGPYHPQTALVLNNLAALLADMGDGGAALPLLERSLTIHERVYGAGDWRTSFVLVNLADLRSAQGDYGAARTLLERALIIRERAWGATHPETVTCLRKLVAALGNLYEQGDEQALLDNMALYPCLTSLERASGQLDPANAGMLGAHLDPDQAAGNLHQLLARLEVKLAQPPISAAEQADLDAASELALLADEHHQLEDYDSAESLLEQALDIQVRGVGDHHLDHVRLLRRLAYLRDAQGQHSAVLPLVQRIADIHVQVLGEEHPATAIALSELMVRYADAEDRAATRALQARILRSMEQALGPDDPRVRNARKTYEMLGSETRPA